MLFWQKYSIIPSPEIVFLATVFDTYLKILAYGKYFIEKCVKLNGKLLEKAMFRSRI